LERGLQVFHPDFEEVVFKTIDEAVRRKNREEVRWTRQGRCRRLEKRESGLVKRW
jgi:hypothetical protein